MYKALGIGLRHWEGGGGGGGGGGIRKSPNLFAVIYELSLKFQYNFLNNRSMIIYWFETCTEKINFLVRKGLAVCKNYFENCSLLSKILY